MKSAEKEGLAVAYALLILKGWETSDMNHSILAQHGAPALIRVKKRAWQHVRAQTNLAGPPAPSTSSP